VHIVAQRGVLGREISFDTIHGAKSTPDRRIDCRASLAAGRKRRRPEGSLPPAFARIPGRQRR
jgi:hypothetical protein